MSAPCQSCDEQTHDEVKLEGRQFWRCRRCNQLTPFPIGARVTNLARFLDACEGMTPDQLLEDKASVERQGRWELDIILTWVLPIVGFWGLVAFLWWQL